MVRPMSAEPKETTASVRMSVAEKRSAEIRAKSLGYKSLSDYLRALASSDMKSATPDPKNAEKHAPYLFFTKQTSAQCGMVTLWIGWIHVKQKA